MRMACFILFAFVFASQLVGGLNTKLPPPSYGNVISILSIDGGGIKGIIPSVILQHLENALKTKDEEATLAGYFDVIAGTSTGGLITAMLASPHLSDPTRPALTPSEIINFYIKYGPSIFNQTSARGWTVLLSPRPKYDGEFLHSKARELLGDTRLHQTLTNVVIPTFDVNKFHQVIFSNLKVNKVPSLDAKLSDICLGTSAAPTLLPPYNFTDGDNEFNLIDGGVVANNPSLVAVSEVIQQQKEKNPDFMIPMKENEHTKILLLSIGTGTTSEYPSYNATDLQTYRGLHWRQVLLESIAVAAGDISDYHLASVFTGLESSDNYYLRIQEYNLTSSMAISDDVSEENMANLVKAGEDLLKQPVKTLNVTSFVPEVKPSEGTNADAIERFVEILYNEKQLRLKNKKAMKKMGRPFIKLLQSA